MFEEEASVRFDVIEVQDSGSLAPEQHLQHGFSFQEWQYAQVFTVGIKQIERDEDAWPFAEQQIPKAWSAGLIDAGNLAIEDRALDFQMFGNPGSEFTKTAEDVPVSREQLSASLLNKSERAETIDL